MSTKSLMGTNGQGGRRYRSWPEALKREIVAASLAPGASVSKVARHYDVNANQLFSWRKRYRTGLPPADAVFAQMVPVVIAADDAPGIANGVDGTIEIDLAEQYRVRVGSGFNGDALRRVLDILERR